MPRSDINAGPTRQHNSSASGSAGEDTRSVTEAPRPVAIAPLPGSRCGRYVLVDEIGRGGMGVVYEARDPDLERRVAIKVVLGAMSDNAAVRMSREAQAVARISHPNVVEVFDVGLANGRPYIVMEYIEGRTLAAWLGPRPGWRATVDVFISAGRGLAAAHAGGLVHRDFKPGNVMLGAGNVVKVLDFGLARPGGESTSVPNDSLIEGSVATVTRTGIAVGTPSYMAPEQHRGQRVTPRADVFAFGVALFEGLYGFRPFSGRRTEGVFEKKRAGIDPEPPTGRVPAALHTVLVRALAFSASDRYASMDELLAALVRIRRTRRRRWAWASAGLVAVAAVAAVVPDSPAATQTPPDVAVLSAPDPQLVSAALLLVDQSRHQADNAQLERAIGTAYAAIPIAVASHHPESHGRALAVLATHFLAAQDYTFAAETAETAVEKLTTADAGREAVLASIDRLTALARQGRQDEAVAENRRAQSLIERFELLEDEDLELRLGMEAAAWIDTKDIEPHERAIEFYRDSPIADAATLRAQAMVFLGQRIADDDPEKAMELLNDAVAIRRRVFGSKHVLTLAARLGRVGTHSQAGRSESCIVEGKPLLRDYGTRRPVDRAALNRAISQCLASLGRFDEAVPFGRAAAELSAQLDFGDRRVAALNLGGLATALAQTGRYEEAKATNLRALAILESAEDRRPREMGLLLYNIAATDSEGGNYEDAVRYFKRSRSTLAEDPTLDLYERLANVGLAGAYVELGRHKEALDLLNASLADTESAPSWYGPHLASAHAYLARAMWHATDRKEDARKLAQSAEEELVQFPELEHELERFRSWKGKTLGP